MMPRTTTRRSLDLDIRVDFHRDRDRKWRSRILSGGRILADSGEGYSRRIDCVHSIMRVVGVHQITWLTEETGREARVYDYGQGQRGSSVVEFYVWKLWVG